MHEPLPFDSTAANPRHGMSCIVTMRPAAARSSKTSVAAIRNGSQHRNFMWPMP